MNIIQINCLWIYIKPLTQMLYLAFHSWYSIDTLGNLKKKKKTTLQYVALSFENLCHWYIRCCFLLTATIKSSHPTTVVPNVGFIYPWEYEAGSLGVCEKKLVNGRKQINNRTVTNDSINMKGKIYGNRLSRGTQAEGWEPLLYMVTDLLKKSLHMQKWLQKKKRNFL